MKLKDEWRFLGSFFPLLFAVTVSSCVLPGIAVAQTLPEKVIVRPMIVVPKGQRNPSIADRNLLLKHLRWARKRYREMLGNRSTFEMEKKVTVFKSKQTLEDFEAGNAADLIVEELFEFFKTDRYSCKHIYLTVFMNPKRSFPRGGGRPFNGGVNTGGGIVVISSHAMKKGKNFQSTLQHELGHAFGLLHVDAYGYQMNRNDSIMSYNPAHHTNGFQPSATPGVLIPEDLRVLALNDRAFAGLDFDKKRDVPSKYKMKAMRHLGPMKLTKSARNDLVLVGTDDGSTYGSSIRNIVHSRIRPSIDRGKIEFDKKTMWHSAKLTNGFAIIRLIFPTPVTLDRIKVYSQHSGKHHGITGASVSAMVSGKATEVAKVKTDSAEAELSFFPTKAIKWEVKCLAGDSQMIVLRGLRFFHGEQELYPQLVPAEAEE